MTWMKDTYYSVHGEKEINSESVTTGKYIEQGGIDGREESTGLGVYYGIRDVLNDERFVHTAGLSKGIADKTFIMQGFGNVGYWASKYFEHDGGKIETVVEYDSAIYKKGGFDIEKLH